jgi:hypothetical protein
MRPYPPLWTGWCNVRYDLHPSVPATSDIRIVAFRIAAIVPVILLRLLGLDIYGLLLLDDHLGRGIIAMRVPWSGSYNP